MRARSPMKSWIIYQRRAKGYLNRAFSSGDQKRSWDTQANTKGTKRNKKRKEVGNFRSKGPAKFRLGNASSGKKRKKTKRMHVPLLFLLIPRFSFVCIFFRGGFPEKIQRARFRSVNLIFFLFPISAERKGPRSISDLRQFVGLYPLWENSDKSSGEKSD